MDQAKKEIDTEIRHWDVLHFQKFFQNPPMNGEQNYMQSLKIGILLSGWSIPISMIKE